MIYLSPTDELVRLNGALFTNIYPNCGIGYAIRGVTGLPGNEVFIQDVIVVYLLWQLVRTYKLNKYS